MTVARSRPVIFGSVLLYTSILRVASASGTECEIVNVALRHCAKIFINVVFANGNDVEWSLFVHDFLFMRHSEDERRSSIRQPTKDHAASQFDVPVMSLHADETDGSL